METSPVDPNSHNSFLQAPAATALVKPKRARKPNGEASNTWLVSDGKSTMEIKAPPIKPSAKSASDRQVGSASKSKAHANKQPAATRKSNKPSYPAYRIVPVVEQLPFASGNFGANNFGASDLASAIRGKIQPASNQQEAVHLIKEIVSGQTLHPKRIGPHMASTVMKSVCTKVVTLAGITPGDAIYIVQPIQAAHKGVIVLRMAPLGTTYEVVAYVAPDRDLEDVSTKMLTLYARLSVAAPMVVGGTTVNLAQMILEMGHTRVGPLSLIPGKIAPLCDGRRATKTVIGPEEHTLHKFTALEEEMDCFNRSDYDPQNVALVRVPGTPAGSTTTGEVEIVNPYKLQPSFADAATALSSGWTYDASLNFNVGIAFVTLWKGSLNRDWLRHLLYGGFVFDFKAEATNTLGCDCITELVVTYSDGSTVVTTAQKTIGAVFNEPLRLFVDTRGPGRYDSKSGLIIKDMELRSRSNNANAVTIKGGASSASISVTFLDVKATTAYNVMLLSGATQASQLAISAESHHEVFVMNDSSSAAFVDSDDSPPYNCEVLCSVLRALPYASGDGESPFSTSGFTEGLKKIGRFIWDNGGKSAAKSLVRTGTGMISGGRTLSSSYTAGTFGENEKVGFKLTGFSFPAVREGNEPKSYDWEIVPIAQGKGAGRPDVTREICDSEFMSLDPTVEGDSCTGAFLLAALASVGVPVKRGCYSFEATDIDYAGGSEGSFLVYPVAHTLEKSVGDKDMVLFSPHGWYRRGKEAKPAGSLFFGPSISTTMTEIDTKEGYPGKAYEVKFWKSA